MIKFAVVFISFYLRIQEALGHGSMYYPNPWQTTKGCGIDDNPHDCWFDMKVPDEEGCTPGSQGCRLTAGRFDWYTNYTTVEEATLPEEMYSSGPRESYPGFHPWASPGAAPVFGNGCGVNGGNPFERDPNVWKGKIGKPDGCLREDKVVGRCCGNADGAGCAGYVGGRPALEYYREGFFNDNKVDIQTWVRGEPAEVAWYSNAHHRGGYAYRLCRINYSDYTETPLVWEVTEECFQNGHLNFFGNKTWVYRKPTWGVEFTKEGWQELDLVTTREGTTPEGSEWASLVYLPDCEDCGDSWAIKDLVEVPESLEVGEYVLSFRWDCQRTPQVWNACATIYVANPGDF